MSVRVVGQSRKSYAFFDLGEPHSHVVVLSNGRELAFPHVHPHRGRHNHHDRLPKDLREYVDGLDGD